VVLEFSQNLSTDSGPGLVVEYALSPSDARRREEAEINRLGNGEGRKGKEGEGRGGGEGEGRGKGGKGRLRARPCGRVRLESQRCKEEGRGRDK
jgi:hypothetical protein